MFHVMYLKNPDVNRIFPVWHACAICGTTRTDSPADKEQAKRFKCCADIKNLLNIGGDVEYQAVAIIDDIGVKNGKRLSKVYVG